MRILAIEPGPAFSVADVHRGWVKALSELGCEVANLNLGDRLDFYSQAALYRDGEWKPAFDGESAVTMAAKGIEAAAFEYWPDVVLITSCMFIPRFTLELLRSRGMKTVILFTESPYEDDGQLLRAPFCDVALLNDPTNLDRFRDANPNSHYIPHAYDPDVHYRRPHNSDFTSDFCFVGTGFPSRIDLFEQVDWDGIDVALAGHWQRLTPDSPLRKFVAHDISQCIANEAAVDLYSNTKLSTNTYRQAGESERPELAAGWAMSPREVEMAAIGTFFLRSARGESDEVLGMLPTFDGPADLEDKIRFWLRHDRQRDQLAADAAGAVRDRTFRNHAERLLAMLQ